MCQALHLSSTRLANSTSNNLNLLRPVERGDIKDYETCQKILDYIFKTELRINPKDHPVMLTVSPLCSPESRAELAKLMFDVFNVPSLCMADQAVLSLFSTGRTTGVVLELGEGMTYCVPVYEGFSLKHAVLSIPVAGGDLTKYLIRNLGERGFNFLDSQADIVRDIKEKLCRVRPSKQDFVVPLGPNGAPLPLTTTTNPTTTPAVSTGTGTGVGDVDETSYELPDGTMIRLDDFCRFHTLEILFAPDQYAASLGVALSGGLNQSFGIPLQNQPMTGGLGTSSNAERGSVGGNAGGSGGLATSSGGSSSSASNTGNLSSGLNNNGGGGSQPLSASGNVSFASQFQQQRHTNGPIQIDLSTNELVGVHHLLHSSLMMIDGFLRRELLKNIVLAGGTSMSKGFGERLKRELAILLDCSGGAATTTTTAMANGGGVPGSIQTESNETPSSMSQLNIITDSQRKYAAWIGASMYASLPTFGIIKITADQYKRDENIVHKKYF